MVYFVLLPVFWTTGK